MEIITKDITESTNDDIAELARIGFPSLTTVVAKYQTRGRGRRGNRWEAPPGNNLLFSTLIRTTVETRHWTRIPQIAGMEFILAVENQFQADEAIKMKWPNDLYYYDKKWSGILAESKLGEDPYVILGMGVNCVGCAADYPEELRQRVTTLQEIFETRQIDCIKLLKSFLNRIEDNLEKSMHDFGPVVEFANRRNYLLGRTVSILEPHQKIVGTVSGIGSNGELIIVSPDGRENRITGGTITEIE